MFKAVEFKNVVKTYVKQIGEKEAFTALKDVSFDVKEGIVTSIIGANGAGKSTIIKHIIGLLKPTSGSVNIFDKESSISTVNSKDIGYLPEVVSFNNSLSVYHNIEFNAKLYGLNKGLEEAIDFWLSKMNISEIKQRSIKKISKGQRQRVAFICSVIHNPKLIILDEPMSGLDPIGRKIIIDAIYDLKKEGATLLICSHLLDDIQKFSDKIILMHYGKVLSGSSLKYILDNSDSLEDYYVKEIGLINANS